MPDRWTLARAGIVNVYQYSNETLSFAGGRLLLRGVNGSGKSTAMNMLLPFLLDGDTRRIDAAGEQSGVLKSWMLAGRDDPQPVGYLWLELANDGEHLTCGCGIRANRASDAVSTWWFVTSRRPGVDLDLVEGRQPLSQDALRTALGADPVFRHDQRAAYRAEVRRRLFGGADIDQHVRLLHVVRSPRVGDRIDLELPDYLHAALPQLSDAALDDAAQPLDDLEEHRRNVEELTRTSETLGALAAVYSSYARDELRRRATDALALVAEVDQAAAALSAAERAAQRAALALAETEADLVRLDAEEHRLREELEALRESPAYQAGHELNDLRDHVRTLEEQLRRTETRLDRATEATQRRRRSLVSSAEVVEQSRSALREVLGDLAGCAVSGGLPLGAPDVPPVEVAPLVERGPGSEDPVLVAPRGALETSSTAACLADLRAAVVHREGDVSELRDELSLAEEAERRLALAATALRTALADAEAKHGALGEARRQLDEAVQRWRGEATAWLERLVAHRASCRLAPLVATDLGAELAPRRVEVADALAEAVAVTLEAHLRDRATLSARREEEQAAADELAAALEELERRELPAPPALGWQREDRGVVLAELVDFDDTLDDGERAGLESAMEAGGLLGAEVAPDGRIVLADGGLVVRATRPVAAPLGRLLVVTVPHEHAGRLDATLVAAVLDSISTDPAALDGDDDAAVVTVDGRFRAGVLTGRHAKAQAEHIGLTARRAALERQRSEARVRLESALDALGRTTSELEQVAARIGEAEALRAALPGPRRVDEALVRLEIAAADSERADVLHAERQAAHRHAEDEHAEAVDKSRRTAANLGLPVGTEALAGIEAVLRRATSDCALATERLGVLARAVDAWSAAGEAWLEGADEEGRAAQARDEAIVEHERVAARLATLEDSVGAAYEEVLQAVTDCQDELGHTTAALGTAREARVERAGELASGQQRSIGARQDHSVTVERALAFLPRLRRVLAVPGLLAAAVGATRASGTATESAPGSAPESAPGSAPESAPGAPLESLAAPVEASPVGLRALASAVMARVPAPERAGLGPDGVRQSLRQRRDSLGSGWDAEDRQPDESVPVSVEVTGPEGQMPLAEAVVAVAARRRELAALLSSEQDEALRNLLQGLVAREVADKMHAADDLVSRMNRRLETVRTAHGIGVSLRWRQRRELERALQAMIDLLAKPPDLRTAPEDEELRSALAVRLDEARREDPEAPYRELIARVLDYRSWHEMTVLLRRPGRPEERLTRRTALSEGEKKIVSYLPLFAAVAASCDALAESAPEAPRFVLLDDAFAKVSEDNHAKLFGLLVELDLDFIATSERLWGTHASVPELAITEVLRDAELGVIVLEHSRWNGAVLTAQS